MSTATPRRRPRGRSLFRAAALAAALLPAAFLGAFAAPEEGYDETAPLQISSLPIPDHFPRLCRRFALLLEARHYLQKRLDEQVSAQAWTNYLTMLDYDRSYFLQSDVDSFEPWRGRLCDDLKRGDLEFPVKVFERFRQRLRERADFVEAFLASEQDYTVDEDYVWKRKDLPWPAGQAEQDDLWRRRMKNELLSLIVSRDLAASNEAARAEGAAGEAAQADGAQTAAPDPADGARAGADTALSTNAPPAVDMSPKAVVGRRYRQYCGIVSDADADYVLERFLSAFTQVYDPHSSYMPPSRVEDFNIDMNLSLCGIGATLQSEDGMAKVVRIMPGGPADRDMREGRLRENDKIFAVGQGSGPAEDIVHLPIDKIVRRIRGEKGTRVVLHVISASDPSGNTTKVVDLVRDDIKLEEAAATGRVVRVSSPLALPSPVSGEATATTQVERAFGYVRLPSFYGSMTPPTDPNFRSCTRDVLKFVAVFNPDVEGMVLDLRGNGGGSLREAVGLVGAFIRTGPVVLVRETGGTQPLADPDPAVAFRKPLVVLIDRASASASEIVAAALQDYGRAVIVGDSKSHGKGSVQNVMPLIATDESYGSLKMTIAAFYRISGSSTQLRGVASDIVLPSVLEYMELGEDKLPNALPWTSIPPMRYPIVYPMGGLVPRLAAKSAGRLSGSAEWAAHMKRVEHVRSMGERVSVPLCYDKRYALAKADAANGPEEYGSPGEGGEDGEDGEGPEEYGSPGEGAEVDDGIGGDVVLREALNILRDLADLQGPDAAAPSQGDGASDWIYRFFK